MHQVMLFANTINGQSLAGSLQDFQGADVRFGDVSSKESLRSVAFSEPVDVVVSCLASRTGGKACHPPSLLHPNHELMGRISQLHVLTHGHGHIHTACNHLPCDGHRVNMARPLWAADWTHVCFHAAVCTLRISLLQHICTWHVTHGWYQAVTSS